jgi:hypothetical protein
MERSLSGPLHVLNPQYGRKIVQLMAHVPDIHQQTKGQADIWIFHRQSPMMKVRVSGIVSLGSTDFHCAEA